MKEKNHKDKLLESPQTVELTDFPSYQLNEDNNNEQSHYPISKQSHLNNQSVVIP